MVHVLRDLEGSGLLDEYGTPPPTSPAPKRAPPTSARSLHN